MTDLEEIDLRGDTLETSAKKLRSGRRNALKMKTGNDRPKWKRQLSQQKKAKRR